MPAVYKRYLNKLPFALFICNKNLKVLYYNNSFKNLFAPDSKNALIGKVIGCDEDFNNCGKNVNCNFCQLRKTLEYAIKSGLYSYTRRILKSVRRNDSKLYFTMTVKKVGKNYMALIEDSLEMNLYNELMAARTLQQNMLPKHSQACNKSYSYFYRPKSDVGGDFLDVFQAENFACGFVADVSGKGIGAAMMSSFIKTAYEKNRPLLSGEISAINEKYRALKTDEREYITLLSVAIDTKNNKFYYANAGHSVPLLYKNNDKVIEFTLNSAPISNWFNSPNYENCEQSFASGDILAIITDGVVETKNNKGQRFGLGRVKDILQNASSSQEFCQKLESDVTAFCSQSSDDMSALAFDL